MGSRRQDQPAETVGTRWGRGALVGWTPDCHGQGEPCTPCGGDGKFHQDREGDHYDGAVSDLLQASAEEPVSVLNRFIGEDR